MMKLHLTTLFTVALYTTVLGQPLLPPAQSATFTTDPNLYDTSEWPFALGIMGTVQFDASEFDFENIHLATIEAMFRDNPGDMDTTFTNFQDLYPTASSGVIDVEGTFGQLNFPNEDPFDIGVRVVVYNPFTSTYVGHFLSEFTTVNIVVTNVEQNLYVTGNHFMLQRADWESIRVYDVEGRIMAELQPRSNSVAVDKLNNGVYVLQFKKGHEFAACKLFLQR